MIKLEFNGKTKMAAEAGRFKMATENDKLIMKSEDKRYYLMLPLELGLDWSRLHWPERWSSDDVINNSELLYRTRVQKKFCHMARSGGCVLTRSDDW